jgi:hypothetical protein
MTSLPIFLHKGSWREFKIALALHLKDLAKHWDSHLSKKIFMILYTGEIRERFLSAFPPLRSREKLDLSLDDIINPIEVFEEKSHRMGCHPGRLTLMGYPLIWRLPGYRHRKNPCMPRPRGNTACWTSARKSTILTGKISQLITISKGISLGVSKICTSWVVCLWSIGVTGIRWG